MLWLGWGGRAGCRTHVHVGSRWPGLDTYDVDVLVRYGGGMPCTRRAM